MAGTAAQCADAVAAMMPGLAPAEPIDVETELLLASLVARLFRCQTDRIGDRDFLKSVRGVAIGRLSAPQRANVMRLAWRYRFQLPGWMRPGSDPDKIDGQVI